MLGSEFRGLAETGTRAYGDDPWFFLRELAQNSRDAGARSIRVSAQTAPDGTETIVFADDGRGMTLAHARRFLFRLYASDKSTDPAAAGRFGIGFWSVLRFGPSLIRLQSRRGRDSWAVNLDAALNARPLPCSLDRPGTEVSLTRPAACSSAEEFARQAETGLRTYCRYLRRNDRRGGMLPLWFSGRNLTEPMTLPGPLSLSFRSGPVEGAVGLGEKPEVRLYARGLPVWRGALLSQMSYLNPDADARADVGIGLAPVFLLNGNHLDVTFSRELAVENRALDLVRRKAEAALRRLLETSLETTFPRTWPQRLGDGIQAAWERLRRPGWHWLPLMLLLLLPAEFVWLRHRISAPSRSASSWFSLRNAPMSYRGAAVGAPHPAAAPFFSYSPRSPNIFRLFAADLYDEAAGFVRGPAKEFRAAPRPAPCPAEAGMLLRLRAGKGDIFLPLSPGQALLHGSLRLDGRMLDSVFASAQGETVARLPAGGLVEYRSCPAPAMEEMAPAESKHLTALPGHIVLPSDLAAAVNVVRPAPVAERAARAHSLARRHLAYDASPATAERYRRERSANSWLQRVLRIGRGDCDVINGLQVLLLRKMGVPARLVIGMIGENGRARPRLHAWGEYFDRGWQVSDATPLTTAGLPSPSSASPAAAEDAVASPDGERAAGRDPPGPDRSALLLALLAGVGLYLLTRRERISAVAPASVKDIQGPLLQVARQAMLRPELWGADNPLRRHRLLPTVNGGSISLRQAKRLLRRQRLFVTANRNPLALAMAASRIIVIDLSQPLFSPLGALLEGAGDTDTLCRLRPQPGAKEAGLLSAVNPLINPWWRKPCPCLLAPGSDAADLVRVALPAALVHPPFFFPRRFIAVAPGGKTYSRASALYRVNSPLAVLRFLRRLDDEGMLGGGPHPVLMQRAARRLLASFHD